MANETITKTTTQTKPRTALRPVMGAKRAFSISLASSIMLIALGLMMILRPLSLTHKDEISGADVTVQPYGSAQQALTRIAQENFTTIENLDRLANNPDLSPLERMVYQYAPLILTDSGDFPRSDDTFIGIYYQASQTTGEEITISTIRYYFFSTDESGGTLIRKRLALFGQPIDRELVYRLTIIDGEVTSSYFQSPKHRLIPYRFQGDMRPVFAIASANNNFRPVLAAELEQRQGYQLLVPFPHHEHRSDPSHDPDFVALAAQEAMRQHGVDLSEYLYVELQNPVQDGLATISVKIQGRWYYLHGSIAGITRPGYNQVGIYLGFAPQPEAIDEMWFVAYTPNPVDLEVISVYIYPRIGINA